MQNDNYVIDEKRRVNFSDPSEAAKWYEARLTESQSALTELMDLLPYLVRLADRVGVDLSEQHHIDKAQTYIDIYEGRSNDLQT